VRRLHLWEWGDQRWLPAPLRCWLGELLAEPRGGAYAPAVPVLGWWLRRCACTRVVDLCSGAGGPWPHLRAALAASGVEVEVLLTDLDPPTSPGPSGGIACHPVPVDVRRVPPELRGCRTMFTALHHFRPAEVRAMLRDAAEAGAPFAAFEWTRRTPRRAAAMLLSPLAVWRDTLRMGSPGAARLFWTFAFPVVPAMHGWDAVVSHLRSYTAAELRELAAGAAVEGYEWEVGCVGPEGDPALTYLLGVPR
jgi:hypothetical protein